MDHYNSRKVAEDYHRAFTKDDGNPELKRKAVQRYAKFTSRLKQGGHILDAGCGTGRFVQYFIKNGFAVIGIDSSSAMIEVAAKNNPLAEFKVMDICHLDFPSNYFDGIWNVATLLHLGEADVKLALQESKRVLKDGGTLYIATRTKGTSVSIIEESTEGGEMMVNYYSASKLGELLKTSGFKTIEIEVEPDDYSRPFDYVFVLAKPST
ncbi:MAG: class I SAM-dependent methyltransferase [Thermoplasmataceae archaeon]